MITNKLKQLSLKFNQLGNIDQTYSGFDSFSQVSSELQKGILSIYMNEMSLLIIDYDNDKLTWINKALYIRNNKVLIYVLNNNHLAFARNDILNNYIILTTMNYYKKGDLDMLINFLEKINIFNNKEIVIDIKNLSNDNIKDGYFYTLKSYFSNSEERSCF